MRDDCGITRSDSFRLQIRSEPARHSFDVDYFRSGTGNAVDRPPFAGRHPIGDIGPLFRITWVALCEGVYTAFAGRNAAQACRDVIVDAELAGAYRLRGRAQTRHIGRLVFHVNVTCGRQDTPPNLNA